MINRLRIILIASSLLLAGSALTARLMTPELQWKKLNDALELTSKTKKKLVLDIYTDWCGWCKRMDADTYKNDPVVSYMKQKFIAAKINPEVKETVNYQDQEASNAQFCSALGVNGYPATAFFDENNQLLTVVGGYLGPDDFLRILKYFGEDIYKTTTWEDFVRNGG